MKEKSTITHLQQTNSNGQRCPSGSEGTLASHDGPRVAAQVSQDVLQRDLTLLDRLQEAVVHLARLGGRGSLARHLLLEKWMN